jgi:hypothetical protein
LESDSYAQFNSERCQLFSDILGLNHIVASSWLSILFVSMMHGQTNIKFTQIYLKIKSICSSFINLTVHLMGTVSFE